MSTTEPASQGALITQRLAEIGMSVSAFARALEVQPSFVYSVMKGERRLTKPETVERAAEVLGISADALYVSARHLPPDAWTIIQRRPEMVQALRLWSAKLDARQEAQHGRSG